MTHLKVALISEEFPPFMFGGIASNCYDLAHSLSKKRVSATVLCGRSKKISIERPNKYLKVIRLPFLNIPPRFMWFQLQNFKAFSKLLRDHDIIHAVNPQSGAICAYLKSRLGVPLITTIHEALWHDVKVFVNSPFSEWTMGDLGLNLFEYPLNEFFTRTCLTRADHIVVCGYTTLSDMKKFYHSLDWERVSVIHNGINFDKINGIKINYDTSKTSNKFSIVFYGRLYWRKGILHLLKALSILKQDFPDFCLKIFGKGPLEKKMRKIALKSGLKNKVHFLGHLPYTNLINEIRKSDLVVLPSLYETGPFIAALEAMACKKPLIVFDFPFVREFVVDMHNGVLAKANDAKDLSDKIQLLLSDRKFRVDLGLNAYKYVKQKHNWDLLVEKYLDVYEKAIRCT